VSRQNKKDKACPALPKQRRNANAARQLNIGFGDGDTTAVANSSLFTLHFQSGTTCKVGSWRASRNARACISATERKSRRAAENAEEREFILRRVGDKEEEKLQDSLTP
jgi:hypothetical protein